MKFKIDFNNENDDDTLDLFSDYEDTHEKRIKYYVELPYFSNLEQLIKNISQYKNKKYQALIDFDSETPIIYFNEVK